MWGMFLNKLWNIFGAILAVAIIFAAVIGVMYLMTLGGPVMIFICAFLFVIATCFVDAHHKHMERIVRKKYLLIHSIERYCQTLLIELGKSGYSENAKKLIELINNEIQNYENEYGIDDSIQHRKAEFYDMLEQYNIK